MQPRAASLTDPVFADLGPGNSNMTSAIIATALHLGCAYA